MKPQLKIMVGEREPVRGQVAEIMQTDPKDLSGPKKSDWFNAAASQKNHAYQFH